MKKILLATVGIVLVSQLIALGAPTADELYKKNIKFFGDLVDIMAGIKDEASADKAIPKLDKLVKDFEKVAKQMEALKPSKEDLKKLEAKYKDQMEKFKVKMDKVGPQFQEVLKKLPPEKAKKLKAAFPMFGPGPG